MFGFQDFACGLPIISSDRNFNYDILDDSNSIMVAPENINQMSAAIKLMTEDEYKKDTLAMGALNRALSLSIDQRASNILNFIKEKIS